MSYSSNPLNRYSTYTYNIALYMIDPRTLGGDVDPLSQGILIADNSRIAEYNISSLTHTHSLDPGIVRTSMGSMFDITIHEQNGAQFLETVAISASRLGLSNHLQAAYAIVIKFKGRLDDNLPEEFPLTFKYYVVFKNVGIKVDSVGSTYSITAAETFTDAFNYLRGVEKMTLTFDALTVGEAIDRLQAKIKDALQAAWSLDPNSQYPNEVVIEFDESTREWAKWELESANPQDADLNNRTHIGDRINMSIFSGTNMHEYIASILQKTNEYKKIPTYPNGYARENGAENPTTAPLSSLKYGFKIITKVENLAWDVLKQDYQKRVTFRIKRHIYTNWIIDSAEYLKTIESLSEQRKRVANIRNAGLLRKRYDYLFTGNNTEVINLDMSFDMSYFVISPVGGGILGDPGVVTQRAGRDTSSTVERIRQAKKRIASAAQALANSSRQPARSIEEADFRLRLSDELDANQQNFSELLSSTGIVDSAQGKDRPANPTPITFAQDVIDDSALYHSPGQTNGAAIQFGAAKMNLENTKDLAVIELTIRGDPYWMGQPNGFLRFNRNQSVELDTADYELGGTMFYLHVKFPNGGLNTTLTTGVVDTPAGKQRVAYRTFDDDGRLKPSMSYSFSGIYQVTNVISEFRGGLFKQTLKAFRDVSVNPGILQEEDAGARIPTIPVAGPR